MNTKKYKGYKSEIIFKWVCLIAVLLPLFLLFVLISDVFIDAIKQLNYDFITSYPSRKASKSGILPALVGSLYLLVLTSIIALPIGISGAIYLEEYAKPNYFTRFIEINISNLAGVPSIIYGLLGLSVFVRIFGMGRSLLAGSFTLALLILPIIIITSRESLRSISSYYREACYALGATRFQAIRQILIPMALPGILTGSILSMSRIIGETAPLIVIGALTYITFLPTHPSSPFTTLPIQIFNWVSRPQKDFVFNAASAIIVLLFIMLLFNILAIFLRYKLQKKFYS